MKSKYVLRHVVTWLQSNIDDGENMQHVSLLEDNNKLLSYIYQLKRQQDTKEVNTIMVVQKALGIEFVFKNQEPIFIDGYKVVNKKASVRKIY